MNLDHLVVAATSLAEGVAWCETTLGVTPGPGGEHPLMGTHNRLLSIASSAFPQAYLEIIAIQPGAPTGLSPDHRRWFDLDSTALQACLTQHGPQLVHWVARVPHLHQVVARLTDPACHPGTPRQASRATPHGLLEWHIALRPDGRRPMQGCLPALIQWGAQHPTDHMRASGVALQSLQLCHPQPQALTHSLQAMGWSGDASECQVLQASQPGLKAVLDSPRGLITVSMPELPTR